MRRRAWATAVAAVLLVMAACTGADEPDTGARATDATAVAEPSPAASSPPSERQRIAAAYDTYTRLASRALARGRRDVAGLRDVTTGRAWRDIGARVRANDRDGVRTAGQLMPSLADADITWDGGDTARLTDCLLNGLSWVRDADGAEETVEDATGTRRPVEARLRRVGDRWVVARVDLVQDADSENPQQDPPFLRGPMPDGPPSCAPPEIEREVLAGYRAFWDAFDRAFGFGRDGPADPDDPALAETSVDPQLSDTRSFFREMNARNETSRGVPDLREPWLLAVTDFDDRAVVAACVKLGNSQTIDADTGEVVSRNRAGQLDYEVTQLVKTADGWKVSGWQTTASDLQQCESPA